MLKHDIVTRLRNIAGFGWKCGQPLKDKGTTFRCSCGCSQVEDDFDGNLSISQLAILKEAADEIEKIRKERDDVRLEVCTQLTKNGPSRLTDRELAMLRDWGWLAHMEVK